MLLSNLLLPKCFASESVNNHYYHVYGLFAHAVMSMVVWVNPSRESRPMLTHLHLIGSGCTEQLTVVTQDRDPVNGIYWLLMLVIQVILFMWMRN